MVGVEPEEILDQLFKELEAIDPGLGRTLEQEMAEALSQAGHAGAGAGAPDPDDDTVALMCSQEYCDGTDSVTVWPHKLLEASAVKWRYVVKTAYIHARPGRFRRCEAPAFGGRSIVRPRNGICDEACGEHAEGPAEADPQSRNVGHARNAVPR